MASRKTQNRETYDVVQWDGLKETALAFFGMGVLDKDANDARYLFDEKEGKLFEFWKDGSLHVPLDWYLIKSQTGNIWTVCPDLFNDQYEIIDEYPA